MNVVLDFAGVLFHWQPAALLARVLPGRDITADEFFEGYRGDWSEFDRGAIDPAPLAMRIAMRTSITPQEALRVIDAVPGELQPDPAMVDVVESLHARGVPIFFLSNMPAPYARALDELHPFIARFRSGIYSGRVGFVKPEAAIFSRAEAAFDVDPRNTLFFDDVVANVDVARGCGWQALHFESAVQCRAELGRRGLL